ncbi:MAG: DUF1611 domain-containing protein [Pseudomonadota bacterium]
MMITLERMPAGQIAEKAKWAFTTRRVPRGTVHGLDRRLVDARPGDLVLARVARIGSHKRLQLASGRPSELYEGDAVVLVCGARYAPDQFEGLAELDPRGADMLAGGGVIGRMRSSNGRMTAPTRLVPLGLLCGRDGARLNLKDYALPAIPGRAAIMPCAMAGGRPPMTVIAAIGASMNAGKTTAVASLAHGLVRAGFEVAAIKATGTGAFGDVNAYCDAGAQHVSDFVDAGMVSTYLEPHERILDGMDRLLGHAAANCCDVALVELADGIFQRETAALLADPAVRARFDGLLFAAPDAASAVGGIAHLEARGLVPDLVTGMLSRSPLAAAEASAAAGIRVVDRPSLRDPAFAGAFLAEMRGNAAAGPRAATGRAARAAESAAA